MSGAKVAEHTETLNQRKTPLFVRRRSRPINQKTQARANESKTAKNHSPRLNFIGTQSRARYVVVRGQNSTHMCPNPFLLQRFRQGARQRARYSY